jgi:type IV pilus assembly protein PilM
MIGIDIGALNTIIISGNWNGNKLQINKTVQVPTPQDYVRDGHITQPDKMVAYMRQVFKENHIDKGNVIFSSENIEVIQRELVLPKVSEKDLVTMIPFEVETHFPIKAEDYCLEYQILEEFTEEGAKKVRVLVAAMPRDIVENYLFLAEELGLRPLGLKLQGGSVARLFAKAKSINEINIDPMATLALVDLGHAKMRVSFINMGRMLFSRTIAFKTKDLAEMIAAELGISAEKAEALKTQCTLVKSTEEPLDPVSRSLREAMTNKADEWIQELQPIFRYFLSMNENNKIDHIILYGGYSVIPGVAEYFQEIFNRPASTVKSVSVLELNVKGPQIPLAYLLNAAGSLIQE